MAVVPTTQELYQELVFLDRVILEAAHQLQQLLEAVQARILALVLRMQEVVAVVLVEPANHHAITARQAMAAQEE